ncbi:MAG TPA: DinB family protein, partial [Candidatus Eisenbacteria bacterium]|nr:DinB family protein [Candidatus Eisenbacteria bacterium]
MHTAESLLDIHDRAHQNLRALLAHCRTLTPSELNREIEGFGYPTVRLQLHHEIGAEKYWVSVLENRMDAEENDADYPTVASLEAYREEVHGVTARYLRNTSADVLNTAHTM